MKEHVAGGGDEPVPARLVLLDAAGQPARDGADDRVGLIGPGRAISVFPPWTDPRNAPRRGGTRRPRWAAGLDAQVGGDRRHHRFEPGEPRDDLIPARLPGTKMSGPAPWRLQPASPSVSIAWLESHRRPAFARA